MNDKNVTVKRKCTYNMRNAIVNYYLLVMFTFFELFLTSQYAKARTDKFLLFLALTGALVVVVAAISLSYHLDKNSDINKRVIEHKPVFSFSVTDIGFIGFFVCACVTTIISDYKLDSLLGSAGRDNGLLLLFFYLGMYFIVSRFYYFKNYVLCAFLAFGCIISALAVLHFFYIDPLGIMNGYSQSVIDDFGSTIGNKNLISSYMCIFLPFAMMMFVVQKNLSVRILCGVSVVLGYFGLLTAGSNSGYLGFFVMLFFMFFICVKKIDLLYRLCLCLTIMFASGLLLRLFSAIVNDKSKGFEQIGKALVYSNYIYVLLAVFGVLTIALFMMKKSQTIANKWPKTVLSISVILIGVAVVGVCAYLFYKYTFIDTKSDIGSLSQIFRFDDSWGTHRGFMWINGVKDFFKFDFIHILFGSGCDTFYHVFEPHFDVLSARFNNSSTDCIHNEYLNYMITQGVLGLLSYLTVIISVVIRAFKEAKNNALALVFVFPVITYCAQALVNLYQPITTPFLFIFIALCECLSRKSNPANKLDY